MSDSSAYQELSSRPLGGALLIVAVIAFGLALGRVRRAQRRMRIHGRPWWVGYAGDLVNLGALLLTSSALALVGFAFWLALLGGFLLTLLTYVMDFAVGTLAGRRAPRVGTILVSATGVGAALPALIAPTWAAMHLSHLLQWLF